MKKLQQGFTLIELMIV
ncbi:MAG: prepilin-type N-terminal cleavage/methylation domain-containing protein, partial [Candidatus Sedimenticola sp. 1PA]